MDRDQGSEQGGERKSAAGKGAEERNTAELGIQDQKFYPLTTSCFYEKKNLSMAATKQSSIANQVCWHFYTMQFFFSLFRTHLET